jgi:hypothetical protein
MGQVFAAAIVGGGSQVIYSAPGSKTAIWLVRIPPGVAIVVIVAIVPIVVPVPVPIIIPISVPPVVPVAATTTGIAVATVAPATGIVAVVSAVEGVVSAAIARGSIPGGIVRVTVTIAVGIAYPRAKPGIVKPRVIVIIGNHNPTRAIHAPATVVA